MASLRDEIGDFVGIPVSFMEDANQSAESRVVFMVLRYHTNKKSKRAFPGYDTIMRESGLSRQKTAEGIKILVKTGWLVKHKQFAKVTEYELRYPAAALSSPAELQQEAALVPPANVVSSAGEQPPYMSEQDRSNKSNGSRSKKVTSELLFAIDELEDPSPLNGIRNQLSVFKLDFDHVYRQWWLKYFRLGGIGRRPGSKATAAQYGASLESYFSTWARNEANKNGNGAASGRPAWMAPEK